MSLSFLAASRLASLITIRTSFGLAGHGARGMAGEAGAAESRGGDGGLKWGVVRTANGRIPVYRDIKNHNTKELTIIRKIVGDPAALRQSILDDFDVRPDEVWLKVGRVEVKGMHVSEIRSWLMKKGF